LLQHFYLAPLQRYYHFFSVLDFKLFHQLLPHIICVSVSTVYGWPQQAPLQEHCPSQLGQKFSKARDPFGLSCHESEAGLVLSVFLFHPVVELVTPEVIPAAEIEAWGSAPASGSSEEARSISSSLDGHRLIVSANDSSESEESPLATDLSQAATCLTTDFTSSR